MRCERPLSVAGADEQTVVWNARWWRSCCASDGWWCANLLFAHQGFDDEHRSPTSGADEGGLGKTRSRLKWSGYSGNIGRAVQQGPHSG